MADESENKGITPDGLGASEAGKATRRTILKSASQVAITAPAVAVLLDSNLALAQAVNPYEASASHILDDFTFGNNEEDVDALNGRSGGGNFSNWNHSPVADDHVP